MILVNQGAEGSIYQGDFLGMNVIVKERIPKRYRHPLIDERLTQQRIKDEARNITRLSKIGLHVPTVYLVDNNKLYLEHIDGQTVKQLISSQPSASILHDISDKIGQQLALMHDNENIHGDLTTSNMIVGKDSKLYLIDFGLSYVSPLEEDKAVDLYVLERAFTSTHPNSENVFAEILKSYSNNSQKSKYVLRRLDEVRLRGRKRDMAG